MGLLRGIIGGVILALGLVFILPAQAQAPEAQPEMIAVFNPQIYAESLMVEYDWLPADLECLIKLWNKESHWNPKADNPHSSAFGIAQLLGETSKDPARQIRQGLKYIAHRHDTPCNAWEFWQRNNYY
jgi:hypothetical protein